MQNILILTNNQPEDGVTAERYKANVLPDQHVIVRELTSFFVSWNGTDLDIIDPRNEVNLQSFDMVFFAGWQSNVETAFALSHWLESRNIPFAARTLLDLYPWSKLDEMVKLGIERVPHPPTYFTGKNDQIGALFDWAHENHGLQFPIIVKGTVASRGEDNFLVSSREALLQLDLKPELRYIIQACIPNQFDYRVLVLDDTVELVIKRTRGADTHVNNTAQGAQAEIINPATLAPTITETALRAARALGRTDIAGVDILVDSTTGEPYVLEVNKTPHMAVGAPEAIEHKLHALFTMLHDTARQ